MIERDEWIERARGVSIEDAAGLLNIKLPRSGEYQGPCPACGGTDRFSVNPRKGVWNCRGSKGGHDAIGLIEHAMGIEFMEACEVLTGEPPPRGNSSVRERDPQIDKERREERRDAEIQRARETATETDQAVIEATRMFESARPIQGTIVEDYLDRRGVLRFLEDETAADLRFIANLPYFGFPDKDAENQTELGAFHCMVAAIRDATDRVIGVHRTYLDPSGPVGLKPPGDRARNKKKKILRKSGGGLIRLGPIGETLAVGEGIETTLSWRRLLKAGMISDDLIDATTAAGISLGNMAGSATGTIPHPHPPKNNPKATISNGEPDMSRPGMILSPEVKRIVLLGDGDSEGAATRAFLLTAGRRFKAQGLDVRFCMAAEGMDFNDMLLDAISRGEL